jgi:hypothetical protein
MDWQPISTAPRDGTHIIGLDRFGAREMWFKRDTYEGEFWMDEGDSEPDPSHWVPMPTMPEAKPKTIPDLPK